jgi:hypothetical protein
MRRIRFLPLLAPTSMTRLLCALALCILAGCATPLHVPAGRDYPGPTAELSDTGFSETSGKAQFFAVAEIDGKPIDNAMYASRRVSDGRGFTLTTIFVQRSVPIATMKLKLVATHQTAAPIHEIASRAAGTFLSLEGLVDFTP